jgi:hypothetical protein
MRVHVEWSSDTFHLVARSTVLAASDSLIPNYKQVVSFLITITIYVSLGLVFELAQ